MSFTRTSNTEVCQFLDDKVEDSYKVSDNFRDKILSEYKSIVISDKESRQI